MCWTCGPFNYWTAFKAGDHWKHVSRVNQSESQKANLGLNDGTNEPIKFKHLFLVGVTLKASVSSQRNPNLGCLFKPPFQSPSKVRELLEILYISIFFIFLFFFFFFKESQKPYHFFNLPHRRHRFEVSHSRSVKKNLQKRPFLGWLTFYLIPRLSLKFILFIFSIRKISLNVSLKFVYIRLFFKKFAT